MTKLRIIPGSQRGTRTVIAAALLALFCSPPVSCTVVYAACHVVHAVQVIHQMDKAIGLKNIIQFS